MLKTNPEKFVPKTILFVENEVFLAIPEFKILEEYGYAVIYVNSGEKAIEVIESNKYEIDLVVLDIDIRSRINGPEIAKHVLAKKELPIVLLTSSKNELLAEIDDDLVYGFVAKNSANRGVLVKTIEAAFKHFQLYKTINEKEQLYRSIFNSSFQFNAILTTEGVLLDGNRTGVNFFGLDVKDYIGHPFWEVPTWKGKEDGLKEAVKEASQGQLVRYKLEVPSLTALAIVDFSLKPVLDKDGKIILLIAEGRDITKYKNIEEKLRQREETFAKYFYKNSNAMTISNIEQGIILDVNDKFIENFGFTKEEVIGKSSLDLPLWLNPQDRLNAIAKLEQDGGVYNFETKLLTKQRDTRDVLFSWAIIEENGRNVLMSSVTDITELNIYREQMQTQQRIESLGVLAAGIAHDFNNLLMGISGNLSLVQYKISEDSPLLPYVNVALDAVYKATGLTGQLRTFAKGDQPRKKMILLQNELSSWIRFSLSGSSNIRLNLLIAENLWPTNVDVGQLNQVVNNLVINAVQAMSNGGNFSVIAKNIEQQDEIPEGLEPGAYILLSFEDSGSGISPENMSKIFDPFFTTKKNGNGLGLATAYSIINKHGGQLIVDSKVNKGTIFKIYLPARPDEKISAAATIMPDNEKMSGSILVLDDDEVILKATKENLENFGFDVTTVNNGQDAISIYKQAVDNGKPFAAVIFDLTIKEGLGGKDALKNIKTFDPNVKAILVSGYTKDQIVVTPEEKRQLRIFIKPYSFNDLKRTLRRMLYPTK